MPDAISIVASPSVQGILNSPIAFQPLLDEIPIAVVILDKNRRVVAMNQAAEVLTGLPAKRVMNLPCRHVLRSNVCVKNCPLVSIDNDGAPVCVEGDIINVDRQRIPVRITAARIQGMDGSTLGYMETLDNMSLIQNLEPEKQAAFGFAGIIAHSPKMESLFQLIPSVAQTDSSVLITGETGTGKDLLADSIHQASSRAKGPFVKVNCGALPETLLESELFGHVKGAFTGAVENKSGRFRLAHNGSLFLTEIGDLPLALQVKLLSFLDDKTFYPIGASKPAKVDVRIIAATHRNLEEMVRERRFREDLLFRLNVVRMHLPPLRERGEDAELIMNHFLNRFRTTFKKGVKIFDPRAKDMLLDYHYPGNVRELRNIVEYAVNVCEDETITVDHLPAYLTNPERYASAPQPAKIPQPHTEARPTDTRPHAANWEDAERELIMDALVQAKGRRGQAADTLNWARSTLWRKMKKHGLDDKG
ncbi:sigma-54 interaction domain-containing protein [Desulfovibrio ferrophilus]|uniref:PAS modulated sigma54 specific transcriptional regulator, Fis family n=1 Tax=Desulfovibrio ferrophilus TaxID=241368 RepID=A0A2Z6AXN9_9BACT|nr:sigma 54-interacting transcriptional regulator [Desulfovibrio ferrophilus]BBD08009.1 PAS modulated sigma54 specific transcriptional regulator, Fis family [Desulfovibrio ferrophilus]